MSAPEPKYPAVSVQLTGQDGNVFGIIGAVSKALRRAGHGDAVNAFTDEVFAATSYDHALQVVMACGPVEVGHLTWTST